MYIVISMLVYNIFTISLQSPIYCYSDVLLLITRQLDEQGNVLCNTGRSTNLYVSFYIACVGHKRTSDASLFAVNALYNCVCSCI